MPVHLWGSSFAITEFLHTGTVNQYGCPAHALAYLLNVGTNYFHRDWQSLMNEIFHGEKSIGRILH